MITDRGGNKHEFLTLATPTAGKVKRAVAKKARETFKRRIRRLMRRSSRRSITQVIEEVRPYVPERKAYFGLTETPKIGRSLEWMRHRMRAVRLKHWRGLTTVCRELLNLGAKPKLAILVAKNSRPRWRNIYLALNNMLTSSYFDSLGMLWVS